MSSWGEYCAFYKIPIRFVNASILDFDGYPKIQELATNLIKGSGKRSAVLHGPPGKGKTHCLYAFQRVVVEKRGAGEVRFINAVKADEDLLREFNEYGSCSGKIDAFSTDPFLFIDDFGSERTSERVVRNYFDIINARWQNELPTFISTNLNPGLIEERFGCRTYDRLRDFAWLDFSPFADWRGL
jgi:DNA replication protein DnaC